MKRAPTEGFSAVFKNAETGVDQQIVLQGISKYLTAKFAPNYDYRKANRYTKADSAQFRPTKRKSNGPVRKNRLPVVGNPQKRGQATGSQVHNEIDLYAKIMDFAGQTDYTAESAASRTLAIELALSQNGTRGGITIYTDAILRSMRDAWGWTPLAAEWCVGDLVSAFRFATQIDVVACYRQTECNTRKLILCETKTGYNNGSFKNYNGYLKNVREPELNNSPLNQAKMQLVMGAAMFLSMYDLSWRDVDLYVVHCPTKGVIQPFAYPVTSAERSAILHALRSENFL